MTAIIAFAFKLYKQGIFANDHESAEDFIKAGESFPKNPSYLPTSIAQMIKESLEIDSPSVPILYSSETLLPWELACCLIDNDSRPIIHIRPKKSSLVPFDVVLTHELIHAFRSRLNGTTFEEFAASYATRTLHPEKISALRTWSCPIFKTPLEAILLFIFFFIAGLLPWFFDFFANTSILCSLIGAGILLPVLRLSYRWRVWNKAARILKSYFKERCLAIIIRLSDREICELARLKREKAADYIQKKANTEWRWALFILPQADPERP